MCINMSIMEKVFHYEATELSVIKLKDEIWFKAKQVALLLGYLDPGRSIRQNVDPEDRVSLEKLIGRGANHPPPLLVSNFQGSTLYLNESSLYSLIFGSKLESAKAFKRWVTSVILPSMRKTGSFSYDTMIQKYNNIKTFKIFNETDLHAKVINFIRSNFKHALIQPGLGELQDTSSKCIESWQKGYMAGSFDIIILNLHKRYRGLAIEVKTPQGNGILSKRQSSMKRTYKSNGFKTLISNRYDEIILTIYKCFKDTRIQCLFCSRKFISYESIGKHVKFFHKMQSECDIHQP